MPPLVGVARSASFLTTLQPGYGVEADMDGIPVFVCLLDVAADRWFSAGDGPDFAGNQPAVPVLDSYRTGKRHGTVGMGAEHAGPPPRASCDKPAVSGQESRRNAYHLGSAVRNL